MKRLWAVSSGSYSDYRVECVCATEKIAEAIVKMREREGDSGGFSDHCSIEEMRVYDEVPQEVTWWRGIASVNRETAVALSVTFKSTTCAPHRVGYPFDWDVKTRPTVRPRDAAAGYFVDVFGLNECGVKKAMSDFLVQLTPEQTRKRWGL